MLVDGLADAGRLADWLTRCCPKGGRGVWTAMKNIGITLARQKITNYLFQNSFQVIGAG